MGQKIKELSIGLGFELAEVKRYIPRQHGRLQLHGKSIALRIDACLDRRLGQLHLARLRKINRIGREHMRTFFERQRQEGCLWIEAPQCRNFYGCAGKSDYGDWLALLVQHRSVELHQANSQHRLACL